MLSVIRCLTATWCVFCTVSLLRDVGADWHLYVYVALSGVWAFNGGVWAGRRT